MLSGLSGLLLLCSLAQAQQQCRTYSGLGKPCVFPYKLNGQFYSECTTKFPGLSSPSCPVKLRDLSSLEASSEPEDWGECSKECPLKHYTSNQQIYDEIVELAEKHPSIAKPFVLGASVRGQPLIGLRMSRDVRGPRNLMKPMVRLVANVQGNEALGRELLLQLARHLLSGYGRGRDERISKLLNETDISILPSLNPDGYDRATEGSCSGSGKKSGANNEENIDINKDFPTWRDHVRFVEDINYDPFKGGRQPETLAMMTWSTQPFVLSANLNSGATLVTYPFDHYKNGARGENLTPDNDIFLALSSVFTSHHPTMSNETKCYRRAKNGMQNGAFYHSGNSPREVLGSLGDFSYLFTNNLELSLELSCCKFPRSYFLVKEWEDNKESLLSYLEQVHRGVKGVVSLEGNKLASGAEIIVWNTDGSKRSKNVLSSDLGEYWRILLPGPPGNNTYTIQARLEECEEGESGRIFESPKQRIIISYRSPLKIVDLRMRLVGYCGVEEVENTLGVIEDLDRLASRLPKQATTNDFS